METTTDYLSTLLETTTTATGNIYSKLLSAADILSDNEASAALAAAAGDDNQSDSLSENIEHPDGHQITFEIPSHSDLERIQSLDTFSTLLKRLGNTVYASGSGGILSAGGSGAAATLDMSAFPKSADGHAITSEQISNSVVLNLADLKNSAESGLERFFQGADMHSIINYLWIGVVTSLIVLSVIFIVFSCYFYRKFREWKKCNKDIRSHMNNDMFSIAATAAGGNGAAPCDTLLSPHQSNEAAYYQMESPPCYTIATGLPTYDEALHHQHFSFGMKFVYPGLAAVHHHPAISGLSTTTTHWEKHELSVKRKGQMKQQAKQQQQQHETKDKSVKSVKLTTQYAAAPPTYDDVAIAATNVLLHRGLTKDDATEEQQTQGNICIDMPTLVEDALITTTASNNDDCSSSDESIIDVVAT